MKFLPHPTFPSQMLHGTRVIPGVATLASQDQAQAVLVAVVKATFAASDSTPLPAAQQKPIFLQDSLFNGADPIRYEHDLASFKPGGDIVVVGAPAPPEPGPIGNVWTEHVRLGGAVMTNNIPPSDTRLTFEWQSRGSEPRKSYAGDAATFDPATMRLPVNFNNLFFNGGRYNAAGQSFFPYIAAGATVSVETIATYDLGGGNTEIRTRVTELRLPATIPVATLSYRSGGQVGAPVIRQELTMNADTVVYTKGSGQFYVVWRGVWDFVSVPVDRYVSLALS